MKNMKWFVTFGSDQSLEEEHHHQNWYCHWDKEKNSHLAGKHHAPMWCVNFGDTPEKPKMGP
jgi:hypothetical protein